MNRWYKLRDLIMGNKIDPELFAALKSSIPSTVDVRVTTSGDSYIAKVESIEREALPKEVFLITEAESPDDLVDMVNDLIFSYKNIPAHYRPHYKRILAPEGSISKSKNLKLVKVA